MAPENGAHSLAYVMRPNDVKNAAEIFIYSGAVLAAHRGSQVIDVWATT